MVTQGQLVEAINAIVLEVEKAVAAAATSSTEQPPSQEATILVESEENKSSIRGNDDALKGVPATAETEDLAEGEASSSGASSFVEVENDSAPTKSEEIKLDSQYLDGYVEAHKEQARTNAVPTAKSAESEESENNKSYVRGYNDAISHMTEQRAVSPGKHTEASEYATFSRILGIPAKLLKFWGEKAKWSQLGYNNHLRGMRGEEFEKPGAFYEQDEHKAQAYCAGYNAARDTGYAYLRGYRDAQSGKPWNLPKYGHNPADVKENGGECCHCKEDHIECECTCDPESEVSTENEESYADTEKDICYHCSDDSRHERCPCTCGASKGCETNTFRGTCYHCSHDAIHKFCPCLCGNSVTYGREEEFGIRPLVSTDPSRTGGSRTTTPGTETARSESLRTETYNSEREALEPGLRREAARQNEEFARWQERRTRALDPLREVIEARKRYREDRKQAVERMRLEQEKEEELALAGIREAAPLLARRVVQRLIDLREREWQQDDNWLVVVPRPAQLAEFFRARVATLAVELHGYAERAASAALLGTPDVLRRLGIPERGDLELERRAVIYYRSRMNALHEEFRLTAAAARHLSCADSRTIVEWYLENRSLSSILQPAQESDNDSSLRENFGAAPLTRILFGDRPGLRPILPPRPSDVDSLPGPLRFGGLGPLSDDSDAHCPHSCGPY